MPVARNQDIERAYQALIVSCSEHQCQGTCDNRCSFCMLGIAMDSAKEEVDNNVQEHL
jgi:hypothetical protein